MLPPFRQCGLDVSGLLATVGLGVGLRVGGGGHEHARSLAWGGEARIIWAVGTRAVLFDHCARRRVSGCSLHCIVVVDACDTADLLWPEVSVEMAPVRTSKRTLYHDAATIVAVFSLSYRISILIAPAHDRYHY